MKSPDQVIVFLKPGEYFVGDARHRIRTLLGSCVSITLWHPLQRIGAMSHFLLSERSGKVGAPLDARYGKEALGLMMLELTTHGVDPKACQAKIFGGGDMFPKQSGMANASHVGRKNGEAAHRLLEAQGISVISESLFGQGHRRILFDVSSGHVWSRQVKPVDAT